MKVLHVIPALAARYGGPSAAVVSMVRHLNRLPGVEAEISATEADGRGGRLPIRDLPRDLPVHLFPVTFSERWKFSTGLRRWLRQNAGRFDVLHIHAVWSFATAAAATAARHAKVPYVVRPAGMLSEYSRHQKGFQKQVYWRLVESRTIAGASAFHVTSEAEADEVRALRSDARLFLIANGVEDAAFKYSEAADSSVLPKSKKNLNLSRILFMSRLHPKKGIVDRLLPAFAAMRNPATLILAGSDDAHARGYEAEIRAAVVRLGLQDRVQMVGNVEGDERWSLLDDADVFVLPSHSENFGIVVAEAMARSCPVVITDGVQSGSHVIAAGAGEVVTGDSAKIADALDRVLALPNSKRIYGEMGRMYAERHFRWSAIAGEIRQMYSEVLGKS